MVKPVWENLLGPDPFPNDNTASVVSRLVNPFHRIHRTGIPTRMVDFFMVNAGKYTSPMDPMGLRNK